MSKTTNARTKPPRLQLVPLDSRDVETPDGTARIFTFTVYNQKTDSTMMCETPSGVVPVIISSAPMLVKRASPIVTPGTLDPTRLPRA